MPHVLLPVFAALIAGCGPATPPADPLALASCPYVKPLHGLMPLLFTLGLLPRPTLATTTAPSDTSSSVVIRPDPSQQIQCAPNAVSTTDDVPFADPMLSGGKSKQLKLDILIPQPQSERPLVIYVPGGGFSQAPKESALDLRTYVAEAGFVVASIQYRTDRDGATYRDGIADVKSAVRYMRANAKIGRAHV